MYMYVYYNQYVHSLFSQIMLVAFEYGVPNVPFSAELRSLFNIMLEDCNKNLLHRNNCIYSEKHEGKSKRKSKQLI